MAKHPATIRRAMERSSRILLPLLTLAAAPSYAASVSVVAPLSGSAPGVLAGVVADANGTYYGSVAKGGSTAHGAIFAVSQGSASLIYSFPGGADGDSPCGQMVIDSRGRLFGVTNGGATGFGTVFMLTPPSAPGAAWTATTLHVFQGSDGAIPLGGLTLGEDGTLFGVTTAGGSTFTDINNTGRGAVFALSPHGWGWGSGGPSYTYSVIYSFQGQPDGEAPSGTLIQGPDGSLFGTTIGGGSANLGTAFQIGLDRHGAVRETILHSFAGGPSDGDTPFAGLTAGPSGQLYGTTEFGGVAGAGSVFVLTPTSGSDGGNGDGGRYAHGGQASYSSALIYSFTGGNDGAYPASPVSVTASGALYGTAIAGGSEGLGVFYGFAPPPRCWWGEDNGTDRGAAGCGASQTWTALPVLSFTAEAAAGFEPSAGLLPSGRGFVTTTDAGAANGYGAVVSIQP